MPELHVTEEWRPVRGYEGKYAVSNLGRVKNCFTGHVLSPARSTGYCLITLSGPRSFAYIHVLVAHAFLGPKPEGMDVNHINCNRQDNRVENLEYCTRSENTKHAAMNGRLKRPLGRKVPKAEIPKVMARYLAGDSLKAIGDSYGVLHSSIYKLVARYRSYSSDIVPPGWTSAEWSEFRQAVPSVDP